MGTGEAGTGEAGTGEAGTGEAAHDRATAADGVDRSVPTAEELSAVSQDYLKTIWTAQEWSGDKISTKSLSEKLGVSASTVSEAVRRLADQGLVDHARYGSIALTASGRTAAVAMVRRHRLIESFLVGELGYGWDEVHDEAEILEHAVSPRFVAAIAAKLGHPERDPHGDPIPTEDGTIPTPPARRLSEFDAGEAGRVARISDADPAMLRYCDDLGIALDTRIAVVEHRGFAGTISIRVADSDTSMDLGTPAAEAIWLV